MLVPIRADGLARHNLNSHQEQHHTVCERVHGKTCPGSCTNHQVAVSSNDVIVNVILDKHENVCVLSKYWIPTADCHVV